MPVMDDEMAHTVSERYIQLYEIITGERFVRHSYNQIESRIENVLNSIFEK
jgi:phosphoribosylaminoimidazole-succinocarboxamide synthase